MFVFALHAVSTVNEICNREGRSETITTATAATSSTNADDGLASKSICFKRNNSGKHVDPAENPYTSKWARVQTLTTSPVFLEPASEPAGKPRGSWVTDVEAPHTRVLARPRDQGFSCLLIVYDGLLLYSRVFSPQSRAHKGFNHSAQTRDIWTALEAVHGGGFGEFTWPAPDQATASSLDLDCAMSICHSSQVWRRQGSTGILSSRWSSVKTLSEVGTAA